jgi:hypothetical protein
LVVFQKKNQNIPGDIGYNFALTGVLIGATLLLLSAFWHQARSALLNLLPESISKYLARVSD